MPSDPSSVTVIRDASGRYFASFVVEVEPTPLPANGKAVGIDLGLASLAVTSAGEKIAPPKFLRSALKRLRRLQRNLKHKQKGSNRLAAARRQVAKLHATIADKRLDFLHQLSTRIIRENQTVVLEDLNVSGMLKNKQLARSIADAGWRQFRILLESKAVQYDRQVLVINRWLPTSQVCSTCGHHDGKKELSIREWQCPSCGAIHDRDVNAALNILAAGLAESHNGRGAGISPPLRWRQAVKRQPTRSLRHSHAQRRRNLRPSGRGGSQARPGAAQADRRRQADNGAAGPDVYR
ncbi:MAG TPA: hypothetical protein DDY43_15035 [Synechococcales bacterium UBA10510]|nr:hypothetical protein [Synechococcales bacterium UBA10510]